ncbi:transposase [Escherichia coli]|nr:transposase [Escherichia coli]
MRAKERLPRKHYSPEFKMELVRLALEEEGSIAALARKHDVNDNLLFKWIRLWQREGRVCRPRKNSSSLPALIPVQLQAGSSLPTFELPSCSPPATCHIKCRGGEITLTHPSAELMSTVLRELMRGRYDKSSRRHKNLAGCRYHRYAQRLQWPRRKGADRAER